MSPNRLQQQLQEAVVHHRAGRLSAAESLYRRLRATAPRNFDVLNLSGLVAYQQGRMPEALELFGGARSRPRRISAMPCRCGLISVKAGKTSHIA